MSEQTAKFDYLKSKQSAHDIMLTFRGAGDCTVLSTRFAISILELELLASSFNRSVMKVLKFEIIG